MVLRTAISILAAVLVLNVPAPSAAQGFTPFHHYSRDAFFNSHVQQTFQRQWAISRMRETDRGEAADALEGGPPPEAGPSGEEALGEMQVPLERTNFNFSGNWSLPGRVIRELPTEGEAERVELERTFMAMIEGYDQLLDANDEDRLRHNVGGAYNFLFTTCYYALTNGQELTEAQQEDMLRQVNAIVAVSLAERPVSERQKQDLYEAAVLAGMLVLNLYNEGRDEDRPDQIASARELAQDLLPGMMGIRFEEVIVSGDSVRIR